jgi:transglutaminase-like putative cysteine protease
MGSYIDGWSTAVDVVDCPDSHDRLECEMRAVVDTGGEAPPERLRAEEAIIFRADSSRVRRAAVSALAATSGLERSQWSSVEAANQWINWRFTYRIGETDADTPIETVVEIGLGVCQDFAHVLIALLRGWGWPARYVSGYQFTGDYTTARIEDQAMHAWVEAYGPGVGWIGLDPTTGRLCDDRYVPVGRGRDYDDVRPVRGVLRGNAGQSHESRLEIAVMAQQ